MTASFIEHLSHQLETDPPKRKGDRTREALKLATAKALEKSGYHDMRVADIMNAANMTHGAFYTYYQDKSDVTLAVLSEFLEFLPDISEEKGDRTAFEAIRQMNARFITLARANAGLMRCLLQVGDENPSFSKIVQKNDQAWYQRVTRSVIRHYPEGAVDKDVILLTTYGLGAMMDELIRRLVVYPDPSLTKLVGRIAPTDKELADALSVIWFRVLYPGSEMPRLKGAARKLEQLAELQSVLS